MALCVGVSILPFTSAPAVAAVPSFHTSLDPAVVRESMQYLMETFGVSEAEALRRLELQNDAQQLDAMLTAQEPESYGGMHMDHENGGELVVSMTRPTDAQPYILAMPDRAHVKTRTVAHSRSQLENARKGISQKIGEGPSSIFLTMIDEKRNSVVLLERDWVADQKERGTWAAKSGPRSPGASALAKQANSVAAERANANSAVAKAAIPVERRSLSEPTPMYTPYVDWGYCHPLYCKAGYGGMRGGLRLNIRRDNGTWGGCTAGFNVRTTGGSVSGWGWVLTAGHCVVGKTNNYKIHHNGYNILNQHGVAGGYYMENNAYPYDFAFLSYIDGTQSVAWLENHEGRNKVLKYCRNGGWDSNQDTPCGVQATSYNHYLNGYHTMAEIKAGWIVCATGSASDVKNYPESYDSGAGDDYLVGTRCGRVIGFDGGIVTDVCARPGDSGGPLFSQVDHTAYGILNGGRQSRSGACYNGEQNNYAPLSLIYSTMDSWRDAGFTGGATFRVITSWTG